MTPEGMYWSGTMLMQHVPAPNPHIPDRIVLSIHDGRSKYTDSLGTYYVTPKKGVHLNLHTFDFEEAKKVAYVTAKLEGYL